MTDWDYDTELTDGQRLLRIADSGETLLNKYDEFLRGDHTAIPAAELEPHLNETELTADLGTLETTLQEIVDETEPETTEMDQDAAVAVHEHVDITRAQAADSGIWSAFAVLYYPWFVDHRWEFNGVSAMKKKFWTQGRALDSMASTFERLWWIAEMTKHYKDGDVDYTLTRRAFDKRRFVFRVFDIQMGRYTPAVKALLEVLYDEEAGELANNDIIDGTVKQFRKTGAVFPYEGQTKSQLVDTLGGIRRSVEADIQGETS